MREFAGFGLGNWAPLADTVMPVDAERVFQPPARSRERLETPPGEQM
jgi:hypothetical protein